MVVATEGSERPCRLTTLPGWSIDRWSGYNLGMEMKCRYISLLLATAMATAATAETPDQDGQVSDPGQAEDVQQITVDSTGDSQATDNVKVLGNLRVIIQENLQESSRLRVKDREQAEASSSARQEDTEETSSETDATGSEPESRSYRERLGEAEADSPVLIKASESVMDLSRLPLIMIEERVPFLTRRGIIFFGRVELDAIRYTSGVLADDSGFDLRRLRLGLAGHVLAWPSWTYKVEVDLTDGENTLSDTYLAWHAGEWGMLKLGNQKVAQTLSGQTSSISIPFMERPLPVLAFTLQHRLGVGYELHRSNWGGTASVFSHDINEQLGEDGYALRLYYNPSKSLRRVAHLGVSGVSFKTDEDARLRARPESHRTDTRLVDTREQDDVDVSSAFGLEFAGLVGPVTVRSEFYRMGWERKESRDLAFSGWYVEGSWFLTGETSNYRQGKFIRPDVRSSRGAWELAARFSTIDLNDEDVEGGDEDNFTLGVNWYSKVHWRFMGHLIKVNADGPEGKENPWILQFRAQYFF